MHANMHRQVDGKLFAAVMDRQKTDINLAFKVEFTGAILESGASLSAPKEPAQHANNTTLRGYKA